MFLGVAVNKQTGQPTPDTLLWGKASQLLAPFIESAVETLSTGQARRY
jgi:hypothetical protein